MVTVHLIVVVTQQQPSHTLSAFIRNSDLAERPSAVPTGAMFPLLLALS